MSCKKFTRFGQSTVECKSVKGFNSSAPRIVTTRRAKSKVVKKNRIPASYIRSEYVFKGSEKFVSWNQPQVVKDKAKKLVTGLEQKGIHLSCTSIEKIILGDPREYIDIYKRLFNAHVNSLKQSKHLCSFTIYSDLLTRLDGTLNEGVVALFAILSQKLGIKISLNAGQFLQRRFTVQKLVLCLDVLDKLYSGVR